MANTAGEIAVTILICIGLILSLVTIINPTWKRSDLESLQIKTNVKYEGLWKRCEIYPTLDEACQIYPTFFIGLSPGLQAGRGFSIVAAVLGLVSLAICSTAMNAVPCSSQSPQRRNRVRMIGGLVGLISGVALLIGVSWFAAEILLEYHRTPAQAERFVFGEALFIGWVASFMLLLGSVAAMCISCGDDDEHHNMGYLPSNVARSLPRKEYV